MAVLSGLPVFDPCEDVVVGGRLEGKGRGLPARTRYRMTSTSTKMTPRMTKTIIKMGGPATTAVSGCGVCSGGLVGGGAVGGGFVVMTSPFWDVVAGRVLGGVMVLVGELTSI